MEGDGNERRRRSIKSRLSNPFSAFFGGNNNTGSSRRNTGKSSKENTGKSTKGQESRGDTNSPYAKKQNNTDPAPSQKGRPSGGGEQAGGTSGKGSSIDSPFDMTQHNNNPGTGPFQPPGGANPANGARKPSGASGKDGDTRNPPGTKEQSGNPGPDPAPGGNKPAGGVEQAPGGTSGPNPGQEDPGQEDPAESDEDYDEEKEEQDIDELVAYFRNPPSVTESELFGDEISTDEEGGSGEDNSEEEGDDYPWPVHRETEAQWFAKTGTSPEGLPKPYSPKEDMQHVVGEINTFMEESRGLRNDMGKLIDKNLQSMTELRDEIKSEISGLTDQVSLLRENSTTSDFQTEIRKDISDLSNHVRTMSPGHDSGIDVGTPLGTPDGKSTPAPIRGKKGSIPFNIHGGKGRPGTPSPLSQSSKPGDTSESEESTLESSPSKSNTKETPEKKASTAPVDPGTADPGTEGDPSIGEISILEELAQLGSVTAGVNGLAGMTRDHRAGGPWNLENLQQQPSERDPSEQDPSEEEPSEAREQQRMRGIANFMLRMMDQNNTLRDTMVTLNTTVATLGGNMNAMINMLSGNINTSFGTLDTTVNTMDARIDTLGGNINTSFGTLDTAVNTINARIDTLGQDMTLLHEDVLRGMATAAAPPGALAAAAVPPGALAAARFYESAKVWSVYGCLGILVMSFAIFLMIIFGNALGAFALYLSEWCWGWDR